MSRGQRLVDTSGQLGAAYLAEVRQSLVNFPALTNATWRLDTTDNTDGTRTIRVEWEVEESRTVFPIVNFGGVRGNAFYQLGFNDIHFRGRGQELSAFYQNNAGEHNYFAMTRNLSFRNTRWGYLLEVRRYAAIEPVFFAEAAVDYQYINQSYGAGISRTFPGRQSLFVGINSFRERYRKTESDPNRPLPGPDEVDERKALLKLGYARNRMDRLGERVSGTHHQTSAQAVRTEGVEGNFLIFWHDFRMYRLFGDRVNVAGRLRTGISSNNNSPFAPFVLDSQVNIRGSGNRIDRGTGQLVLNLEYRYTVWRDRRERFAGQLVGFSDLGSWRNPGGDFSDIWDDKNIRHFIGGGLRLSWLKAQGATIRLDYGVDVRNSRERGFVAGFGQYF